MRYELGLRPEKVQWTEWVAAYEKKINQALDHLERCATDVAAPIPSFPDIGTACALGYLDLSICPLEVAGRTPRGWQVPMRRSPDALI